MTDSLNRIPLNACPFCQGTMVKIVTAENGYEYWVHCTECNARGSEFDFDNALPDFDEIARDWNKGAALRYEAQGSDVSVIEKIKKLPVLKAPLLGNNFAQCIELWRVLEILQSNPKPAVVSLEKCAKAACSAQCDTGLPECCDWTDFLPETKAVLDAAGVKYSSEVAEARAILAKGDFLGVEESERIIQNALNEQPGERK